jgi:hypothetical protein
MRRTFGALVAAGVLVTILAGTASAAPSKHVGKTSVGNTSFVASACVDSQNEMVFRVDWANETIDQSQLLTVTWTLRGGRLPTTPVVAVFSPEFDATSWADTTSTAVVGPKGPIDWNKWRTIGAAASGAFNATTARAIRRPGRSWPTC